MGRANVEVNGLAVNEDQTVAEVQVGGEPKRGRGRPAKNQVPAAQDNLDQVAEAAPETPADTPTPAPSAAPAPANANVVEDLTPEKARETAIAKLQQFFGKSPNNMGEITRLQTKYGVKLFKEVGDDRAAEFLADVQLLVAGTPAAA